MHAQEAGMGDEVVDVGLDQRARARARGSSLGCARRRARPAAARWPRVVEDGAEEILLAGEDGVDGAHRHARPSARCPAAWRSRSRARRRPAPPPRGCAGGRGRCAPAAPCPAACAWPPPRLRRTLLSAQKTIDNSKVRMVIRNFEITNSRRPRRSDGATVKEGRHGVRDLLADAHPARRHRARRASCARSRSRRRSTPSASSTTGRPSTTSSSTTRTSRRPRSSSPGWRRKTKQIHVGTAITNITAKVNHPARVAERIATLDHLSEGRVEFGTGRGSSSAEWAGFDIPSAAGDQADVARVARADPAHVARRALRVRGQVLPHARSATCCRSRTPSRNPPIWVACSSPPTFAEAGELGLGALCFTFGTPDADRRST